VRLGEDFLAQQRASFGTSASTVVKEESLSLHPAAAAEQTAPRRDGVLNKVARMIQCASSINGPISTPASSNAPASGC